MSIRNLAIILCFLGFGLTASHAQPSATKEEAVAKARPLFKEGNDLMRAKNYVEAAKRYEEVLKILPDDPSAIFNAASALRLSGDTARAVVLFKQLKQIDPGDWGARERLVQIYQSTNQIAERDRERKELIDARNSGIHKSLNAQTKFARDRFKAGGREMWAYEFFDFQSPLGRRYMFENDDSEIVGPNTGVFLELSSSDEVYRTWLATVSPKPATGVRLFRLSGYVGSKQIEKRDFVGEPIYDDVKKLVVDILTKEPAVRP